MSNYRSNLHSPKRPDSLSEAQTIIRQQAYDLKLLSNDNQLKAQQIDMLSEKIRELEESTNGYQTQVSVLEESINISNQEFKAKWHAEQTQTLKLSKNNKALLRTNQQLQQYIKELEQRQTSLQEALQEILGEVQGLKQRSSQAQQAVIESKEILGQKQKALEMADATIVRSRIENEELKKDIGELADKNNELEEKLENVEKAVRKTRSENEELQRKLGNVNEKNSGLEKELEASKKELEQIGDVEARYILLKGSHERDTVEISNVRHSYELLKRKYEDLQHEHESKMIVFEQVEAQIKLQAGSIEGMERQLEKFKGLAEQKEEENTQLVGQVNEMEETLKTVEANISRRMKDMVGLMENQVVDDIEEEIEDVNMRTVMMGIVRLNRDVGELTEKLLVSEEEYKYLEKEITTLAQEKEEIAVKHDELARECERLAELEESARKEKEDLQIRFDMELERLTNIVHENEGHLDSAIQSKENDIQILLDEREKLRELLETQEANARETKSKFLALAEEASLQKGRLERISYVITAMLKVFLNLLVKFKLLGKHKDFLGKYFWKYRTLRQSLEERPLAGKDEEKGVAAAGIRKFKRAVTVVKIIARLRRLKRKGRDTNVDEYEVMNSLDNMPDELRRFICELFKYDRLGIEKGLLKDIQASISSFDGLNENSIIGGIISKIGLLKSPEVNSILSEWSVRGASWSSMEGYDREYASRSPYTGGHKRTEGFSSGGKGREYYRRAEDLPRQTGSKEQRKGHSEFIKEFDSLREDSGHWTTNQSKLDEISEIEDGPPLNERVNKTYGSHNTLSTRRDEMKMQKQVHGHGQRINTAGSIDRNSLWGGPLSSLDEYSTPGFNSPGEGNLSERKPGSRKYESIGL